MRLTNLRVGVFAAFVSAALAVSASAAPILTANATITFTGDVGQGPTTVSDIVAVAAGPEIQFGDGTNIGTGILLDFEHLDLGGLTITYRIQGGSNVGAVQEGYGDNGMVSGAFSFSGLSFAPSASIVGIDVSLTDVIADTSKFSFTANSVTMSDLQTYLILESPENTGLVTIRLITREGQQPPDAPEPASLALLGIGVLAGARRAARRR